MNEKEWTPNQLREFRKARKLTQAEAGKLLGVTHAAWNHWENSRVRPPKSKRMLLDIIDKNGLAAIT